MKQSCNSATIQFYVGEKLSKDREGFDNKSNGWNVNCGKMQIFQNERNGMKESNKKRWTVNNNCCMWNWFDEKHNEIFGSIQFGIWYSYALPYIRLFHILKNVDGSKLIKALCICREYQLSSIASFIRLSILFLLVFFRQNFSCVILNSNSQLMYCGADPRWDQFYRRFSYMTTIQIALEHFFIDAYIERRDIRHKTIHFELFLRPFDLTIIIWS